MRIATMFRIAVILSLITGQVLSAPKPYINSRKTIHTERTHHSFEQRNPSTLNQLNEISDNQLNFLDYSGLGNRTEQKKNRTDVSHGQVIEEHRQIVTDPQSRLNSQSLLGTSSNSQSFGQQPEDLSQQQPNVIRNYTQQTSENLQFDNEHQEHSGELGFRQQHQDHDLMQQIDSTKQKVDDLSHHTKHKREIDPSVEPGDNSPTTDQLKETAIGIKEVGCEIGGLLASKYSKLFDTACDMADALIDDETNNPQEQESKEPLKQIVDVGCTIASSIPSVYTIPLNVLCIIMDIVDAEYEMESD